MAGRRGVKKMMKRLTERNSSGNGYFPECFKEPCLGLGCKKNDCVFIEQVCDRLADYEDTGLSPEEVTGLCDELKRAKGNEMARGFWRFFGRNYSTTISKCSCCGALYDFTPPHCPNCGAKMEEDDE